MNGEQGKVLIAAPVHAILTEGLSKAGYSCVIAEKITQEQAYELIQDCVGVITSTRLQLDPALIDAAPKLRWIGRMGSGMEVIDVPYATQKGIRCYGSPEGNSNAVAEHALGMLLSLTKRITHSHEEVEQGKWLRDANRGIELEDKTIGIIGFGNTGRAFAKKLQGFDMKILAYDKYHDEAVPTYVEKCADLTPIYKEADIVSFHVPLQNDTTHYFNETFMGAMNKGFILINTSRGIVAEPKVILEGLEIGKIRGVCLDVFEEEPMEKMSAATRAILDAITQYPQAIVTPHIAGYSYEAVYKMSKVLLERILT
ncbi:MAG: NAD(P)-dependent oxidoreductase [Bacteroidota bacterium]